MELPSPRDIRVCLLNPVSLPRDCLARVLKGSGITVVSEILEPRQFLSRLKQDRPHVAVVDLPALRDEGVALLREAHQFHPEIQLLAILDGSSPGVVEECLQAGAAGYVDQAACGCESVIEAIRALARGDRVFPALFLETFARTRTAPDPSSSQLQGLSARERQVLAQLSVGADNGRIAALLGISERTVKAHVSSLYRKLGQKNRTQLALLARELGVHAPLPPPPEPGPARL